MSESPRQPDVDASSPTVGSESDPDVASVQASLPERRSRAALWLAILGIPSGGITAIAGLALGLAGLGEQPRRRAIVATGLSLVVLAGWIGGLVGVLEAMRTAMRDGTVTHVWPAGGRLSRELIDRVVPVIDPADPRPPSHDDLDRILQTIPTRYREFGDPPEPLSVQPLELVSGAIARWRVGIPREPSDGSKVTDVDERRSGIFVFAPDGREIWSFRRAFDPTKANWDDREAAILAATRPAAEAIVAAARAAGGELPDAIQAAKILEALGPGPHPTYRPRPGGIFDLVVPGSRERATFAAFGGVVVPVGGAGRGDSGEWGWGSRFEIGNWRLGGGGEWRMGDGWSRPARLCSPAGGAVAEGD